MMLDAPPWPATTLRILPWQLEVEGGILVGGFRGVRLHWWFLELLTAAFLAATSLCCNPKMAGLAHNGGQLRIGRL